MRILLTILLLGCKVPLATVDADKNSVVIKVKNSDSVNVEINYYINYKDSL